MGRILLIAVGCLLAVGCAGSVYVEPEAEPVGSEEGGGGAGGDLVVVKSAPVGPSPALAGAAPPAPTNVHPWWVDAGAPLAAASICLPAGVVAHLAPAAFGDTCAAFGDTCGLLTLTDGSGADCGCGNAHNVCNAGRCECSPATAPEACQACPGRVARYCGEASPKTQQGCTAANAEIDGDRVWCCDS